MITIRFLNKNSLKKVNLNLLASFSTSSECNQSLDVATLKATNLASYSRGTGGRSSFNGNVATVFGASGMMGRILCNRLGKEGTALIIPYRGDKWDIRSIKMVGDLGQCLEQEIDIRDPEKIRRAIQYSNIVINCIGTNYETNNFSYRDVHVDAARLIARISRECKVEKFIHFSALNASPNPQVIFRPSQYLISKYEGELAVKEEFNDAVIIRPSNIYGESDKFLYYYTRELRRFGNYIDLWKNGEMTIKMPVNQMDVADGVMKIIHDKEIKGITYDFVGPDRFLLSEIVDYIYHLMQRDNIKRTFLSPLRLAHCYVNEKIFKRPTFNLDTLEREFISDSLSTDSRNPTLKDLGIEFRRFDESVRWNLRVYNKLSYYNERLGEFAEAAAPKPLSEDFEFQLRRKIRA